MKKGQCLWMWSECAEEAGLCGLQALVRRRDGERDLLPPLLMFHPPTDHPPWTFKSVWRLPLCVSPTALVGAGTAGEKAAATSLRMLNEVRSGDGRHNDCSSVEILSGECLRSILPFGVQLHTGAKLIERFFFLIIIICYNLLLGLFSLKTVIPFWTIALEMSLDFINLLYRNLCLLRHLLYIFVWLNILFLYESPEQYLEILFQTHWNSLFIL